MSHTHSHGASSPAGVGGHAGGRHRWRLAVAFVLVAAFFVVELVAGLLCLCLHVVSLRMHRAAAGV
ncbi:MAG: cation diffusion facilitator family transporter, partial [Angustibacter sp.]